ncbi:hypothetical protein V5F77_10330 [Xanthobacter sp. DSM 24535]|uniref:hypothetical protein n=1 Tax=Roseixanthobacter psychrophilus TaxID=3119917 RepID=UPI0037282CF5
MNRIILSLMLLCAGISAAAARPASYTMACASVAGLVNSRGAVLLSTSPTTFDRYVRDITFCMPGEALRPQWVRSRDNPQCFIGYTCYEPERGWRWW